MKKLLIGIIFLLMIFPTIQAQQTAFRYNATGLEVEHPKKLKILVEKLGQESQEWGLTEKRIRTEAEVKLKPLKIASIAEDDYSLPYRFYIEIQLLDTTFHIRTLFERVVSYRVKKEEYHTFGTVFSRTSIGINSQKDGNHILRILNRFLDDFLKEFQKANHKKGK